MGAIYVILTLLPFSLLPQVNYHLQLQGLPLHFLQCKLAGEKNLLLLYICTKVKVDNTPACAKHPRSVPSKKADSTGCPTQTLEVPWIAAASGTPQWHSSYFSGTLKEQFSVINTRFFQLPSTIICPNAGSVFLQMWSYAYPTVSSFQIYTEPSLVQVAVWQTTLTGGDNH